MSDYIQVENQQRSSWTRCVVWFRLTIKPFLGEHKWTILFLLGVVSFILGIFGFGIFYSGQNESVLNLIYLTLQLFVLRSGIYQGPSILLLDIARFSAPLLTFVSIIVVVTDYIYKDAQLFWLKVFGRDHIIICGLGYIGPIIARHYHKKGALVVIIEKDPMLPEIEKCKDLGILVITGDAADGKVLLRAEVRKARMLFAVTGNDELNAKVVFKVNETLTELPRNIVSCYVHVVDPKFSNLLRAAQISVQDKTRIKLEFFNIYQITSYCIIDCIEGLPPVSQAPPDLHILIAGLGKMGESLLINLAKRWREFYGPEPEKRLMVSILDQNAEKKIKSLKIRYKNISKYCKFSGYSMDFSSDPEFFEANYLYDLETDRRVDSVFICTPDEPLNFATALYLNNKLDGEVPIIVRTVHSKGFAHFFNNMCNTLAEEFRNVHVFPLVSCSCCIDSLTDGINEMVAQAIHENYIIQNAKNGIRPSSDPAMQPWYKLHPEYKESNRDQAAHMKEKLERIGYTLISQTDWSEPLFQFTSEQVEQLAIAEHDRWMTERISRGWKSGLRDPAKKTSPYLVSWEELEEPIRDYDRNFIRSYPVILSLVDLKIVPIPEKTSGVACESSGTPWTCVTNI
jgi:voltage-gated potassium channel Kch